MENDQSDELDAVVTPSEVATQLRVPVSLVRYAIDAGCPTCGGKLSARELLEWLVINYNKVRQLAGLRLLPLQKGLSKAEIAKTQFRDHMLTVVEFIQSRANSMEIKDAAADVRTFLLKRANPY